MKSTVHNVAKLRPVAQKLATRQNIKLFANVQTSLIWRKNRPTSNTVVDARWGLVRLLSPVVHLTIRAAVCRWLGSAVAGAAKSRRIVLRLVHVIRHFSSPTLCGQLQWSRSRKGDICPLSLNCWLRKNSKKTFYWENFRPKCKILGYKLLFRESLGTKIKTISTFNIHCQKFLAVCSDVVENLQRLSENRNLSHFLTCNAAGKLFCRNSAAGLGNSQFLLSSADRSAALQQLTNRRYTVRVTLYDAIFPDDTRTAMPSLPTSARLSRVYSARH